MSSNYTSRLTVTFTVEGDEREAWAALTEALDGVVRAGGDVTHWEVCVPIPALRRLLEHLRESDLELLEEWVEGV